MSEAAKNQNPIVQTPVPPRRRRRLLIALVLALVIVLLIGGGISWFVQKRLPHFFTVKSGVLYRSGQPRGIGLQALKFYGIRTVINLRKGDADGVEPERQFAEQAGISFHLIPVGHSHEELEDSIQKFLKLADDPANRPILVHCSRGKERSGLFSAIYRIEYERWPNQRALMEMYQLGLRPGSMPVVEEYVWRYHPRWRKDEPTGPAMPPKQLKEVEWQE